MPAYILVKASDGWNPDDLMVFNTGFPVYVGDINQIGGKQVPPKFCQVVVTDATREEAQTYLSPWLREIDWEFVGHDYAIDGHRLRVFVKPEHVSVSGLNSLTKEQVETFLNRWGASIVSIAANSVTFDVTVFNAVASTGFWGRNIPLVSFSEKSYYQTSGIHRIQADYSNDPDLSQLSIAQINQYITGRGGVIVTHPTGKVTFDIARGDVFDQFKLDVRQAVDGTFAIRQFKVPSQYVQMALDNGGTLNVTRQQLATYIYNRLND